MYIKHNSAPFCIRHFELVFVRVFKCPSEIYYFFFVMNDEIGSQTNRKIEVYLDSPRYAIVLTYSE